MLQRPLVLLPHQKKGHGKLREKERATESMEMLSQRRSEFRLPEGLQSQARKASINYEES